MGNVKACGDKQHASAATDNIGKNQRKKHKKDLPGSSQSSDKNAQGAQQQPPAS